MWTIPQNYEYIRILTIVFCVLSLYVCGVYVVILGTTESEQLC